MVQLLGYMVAINTLALCAFGWDKYCAVKHWRRISEKTLLTLALIGGSVGAYAGRWVFRHKTRKEPFVSRLKRIVLLQIGLIACVTWLWYSGSLPDLPV